MRVNDDHRTVNAAEQLARPSSLLSYGRIFTKFRKRHKDVLVYGDFELLDPDHSQVYTYRRFSNNKTWVLVLNFSGQSVDWDILPKVGKPEHDPRGRHPHALLGLQDGKDGHFRM
jgi:oligo-1,6-glucosidase